MPNSRFTTTRVKETQPIKDDHKQVSFFTEFTRHDMSCSTLRWHCWSALTKRPSGSGAGDSFVCLFGWLRSTGEAFFPSSIIFVPCSPIASRLLWTGEEGDKADGVLRQSERSHSVMLSVSQNVLQVDAWHVLYIFPQEHSLNKYRLIYSSQEMNFYLCVQELFSLDLWGFRKYTHLLTHT